MRYVELATLFEHLDRELAHIDSEIRQKLYQLMSYSGELVIAKEAFIKIMQVWTTFSANDINNDNELDVDEIKMMIWLLEGKKPINQRV